MVGQERDIEQEKGTAGADSPESAEARAAAEAAAATESTIPDGAPLDVATAAERLAAAEAEIARLKNEYLRALADAENVRRRAARDRQEASQYAISSFARDLLSVTDNLQRALGSVDEASRKQDPALDALMNGVELTEKELLGVLEKHGVKPIAAKGELFDPHRHEALYEISDDSVPQGTVVQVIQPGYTIHDRTLRPARVAIARGGPKPVTRAETDTSEAGEDETVVQLRRPGTGEAYRKPGEGTGSRVDETH
jgi:molecular chaperone GrpE